MKQSKKVRCKIKLYTPHHAQKKLHDSKARFIIVSCGRRFGKTMMAINELVKFLWENKSSKGYWVAPIFRQCRNVYKLIVKEFKSVIMSSTISPMEIFFLNGSVIKFASTENASNIRGDFANMMIIDEAASIDGEVFNEVLRPMLSDTQGRAIIISTPKSLNWFHTLFQRGEDPLYPEYESFTFPTSSNPFIAPAEIEEVKRSLPDDVFRQEYLAQFLEGTGTVFRNIMECIRSTTDEDSEGSANYMLGWDVAKHTDFSCIAVINTKTNHVVELDRFNRIDYTLQVKRVENIARKYNNAKIIVDSTGVGDPILEMLESHQLNVEGFNFTNTSKQQLIEHLAVQLEQQGLTFPRINVLINELVSYQYEISRAGNMKYNAPNGQHDDCVIALALSVWGAKHQRNPRVLML